MCGHIKATTCEELGLTWSRLAIHTFHVNLDTHSDEVSCLGDEWTLHCNLTILVWEMEVVIVSEQVYVELQTNRYNAAKSVIQHNT